MSDNGFDAYWSLEGARYSTGDHKERARHAWDAALKTTNHTTIAQGFWLDALDQPPLPPPTAPLPRPTI